MSSPLGLCTQEPLCQILLLQGLHQAGHALLRLHISLWNDVFQGLRGCEGPFVLGPIAAHWLDALRSAALPTCCCCLAATSRCCDNRAARSSRGSGHCCCSSSCGCCCRCCCCWAAAARTSHRRGWWAWTLLSPCCRGGGGGSSSSSSSRLRLGSKRLPRSGDAARSSTAACLDRGPWARFPHRAPTRSLARRRYCVASWRCRAQARGSSCTLAVTGTLFRQGHDGGRLPEGVKLHWWGLTLLLLLLLLAFLHLEARCTTSL
mmetsp:Transcript_44100/g.94536  ORF Transcript_44100/g.94536 Transcript_44100/m.94536 type:complete len:262 (+) Transcript_44100:148-933(+)